MIQYNKGELVFRRATLLQLHEEIDQKEAGPGRFQKHGVVPDQIRSTLESNVFSKSTFSNTVKENKRVNRPTLSKYRILLELARKMKKMKSQISMSPTKKIINTARNSQIMSRSTISSMNRDSSK